MFPTALIALARQWPVDSQQTSRRNAMIASTALAQRRAEREDVEEFLSSLGKDDLRPTRAANG